MLGLRLRLGTDPDFPRAFVTMRSSSLCFQRYSGKDEEGLVSELGLGLGPGPGPGSELDL